MAIELEAHAPTTISRLRGLLEVTRLVGSDADLPTVLTEIARILKDTLGYGTVVINLYRPAWDDFWVAAVEGTEEARRMLMGATYDVSAWEQVLDPRFERRGAYPIPTGSLEWEDLGPRWNPTGPASSDPDAWQPDDELFVPFRHSDGRLLGILSLGEPVSGRRASDEELDVLVAVAGHAALAVQSAQEAGESAQNQQALKHLLEISTSLAGRGWELDDLLQMVCEGIRSTLGFRRVAIELVDEDGGPLVPRASTGWAMDDPTFDVEYRLSDLMPLMDPKFEVAGCYLLPSEAVSRLAPALPVAYRSEVNGRGPLAWSHHWLIIPLKDVSGVAIGVMWADDPADLLLPSEGRLGSLRTFANQAATAIESHQRDEALLLSEERFRRVFEESPLGMVLVDGRLRIIDVNEATARMLGRDRSDFQGRHVLSATHPDDAEVERELLEKLLAGSIHEYTLEKRCCASDGRTVWVNLTAARVGGGVGRPRMVLRILEDVTERRRVRAELDQVHAARRSLLKRVVEVAESERTRVAADIHDGPIQRLSAMTIRLESAKLAAQEDDWESCWSALDAAQVKLAAEIGSLRRMMRDLRPPVLDERGLGAALQDLAGEVHAASGLRVEVSDELGECCDLDEELQTVLYRIAQEAMTNVMKHARASEARIRLSGDGASRTLEIEDDGCGFAQDATPADGHFGLITMRERAEMAGGSLVMRSTPGAGTQVQVTVPAPVEGAT